MKIAIFASIWAQNLWDELILKNEIKLLEKKYSQKVQFYVFSYDYKNPFLKQDNIEYIEYCPIWVRQINNIWKNLKNFIKFINITIKSDLIIIWWGWIIYDNENQSNKNPLNQWLLRKIIFSLLRKKIEFFAVWIFIKNKQNLKKVKIIFKGSHNISVRDKYSYNLLKSLNIKSIIVNDPVLYDNNELQKKKVLIWKINSYDFWAKYLRSFNFIWKKVWISFRSWYFFKKNEKLNERLEEWKINEIINYILQNGWEVILLVHSFHNYDIKSNDYNFLSKFANKKWVIITEDIYQTYLYYKKEKIDLCLSMRLHSMILSQVYGIPFIWISYSNKTEEYLNGL